MRLSPAEVTSLRRLRLAAGTVAAIVAVLAVSTASIVALQFCVLSLAVAVLAHLALGEHARWLGLLFAALMATSGCTALDLRTPAWMLPATPVHLRGPLVTHRLRVAPDDLDQLVAGCNVYLLTQRDGAATEEQRVRKRQRVIAVIGAAVEVVVGSVALSLKSYNQDKAAALTGGIGSIVTGALSGAGIGLLTQPDPAYGKRRDAILKAWGELTDYSAGTTQPDSAQLASLKRRLREACAGGVIP